MISIPLNVVIHLLLIPAKLHFSQAVNLQLGQWQQVNYNTSALSGRHFHAGVFLSSTNEYLVSGGWNDENALNDLHSINMTSLQSNQLSESTPLGIRGEMAYTSDLESNFYAHGGWENPSIAFVDDFWHFNSQTRNWTQLAKGPSARYRHCMEWDQGRGQLILFSGVSSSISLNDVWTYSIETDRWQLVTPDGPSKPAARYDHACAFNTQTSKFHVHGGIGMLFYQDLWQFDFTSKNWTLLNSGNSDVQRHSHSMRYSKSFNSLLLFFGFHPETNSYLNTINQYSFNNQSVGWTLFQVSGSRTPSRRRRFSTGFNPQTGEFFVFGGYTGALYLNDFWKFQIELQSNTSTKLTSSQLATISSTSRPGTTQTLGESAQVSITVYSQIRTVKSTTNAPSMFESISSIFTMFQTNHLYLIAFGCILLVLICCLCHLYRRWRQRRVSKTSTDPNSPIRNSSSHSYDTNQRASSEYSTTSYSTSMFNTTSQQNSDYSPNETMSITLASTELGLSLPAYMSVEYRLCIRERQFLAQGGFGLVILADALDKSLKQFGDLVIVKKLKQPQLSDRDIQLFYQEISLMEYFKNEKFLAKLLGFSIDPYCLIMKYYEMGSLTQFLKTSTNRCKLNLIAFSKDIAMGLQAMHLKGVVHNDVKPDNVLLDTYNGETFCVLSDLGISQVITPQILKVGQFQVAQIKGMSLVYAAPERIEIFRNKSSLHPSLANRQVIFSWDLYSLGVIMFELMTAQAKLF